MKQVVCENCGASFSSEERVCPYCGAENVPVSVKEQMDYIRVLKKKEAELNTVIPHENAKHYTRKINQIGLWVVVLFLLLAVIVSGFAFLRNARKRSFQKEALEKLEGYYQAKDFASMEEYLNDHYDLYSATFDKYNELADIYYSYRNGKEYLEEDLKWLKESNFDDDMVAETLKYDLGYFFRGLWKIRQMEENDFIYDEQDGAEYLRQLLLIQLKDVCLLTDEEIKEGTDRYVDYSTDYTDLAEIVIGRIS